MESIFVMQTIHEVCVNQARNTMQTINEVCGKFIKDILKIKEGRTKKLECNDKQLKNTKLISRGIYRTTCLQTQKNSTTCYANTPSSTIESRLFHTN